MTFNDPAEIEAMRKETHYKEIKDEIKDEIKEASKDATDEENAHEEIGTRVLEPAKQRGRPKKR